MTCWGPEGGGGAGGGGCWHRLWLLGHIVSSVCPLFISTEDSVFWSAPLTQRRDGYGQTPEIPDQADRSEEVREDKGEESHFRVPSARLWIGEGVQALAFILPG